MGYSLFQSSTLGMLSQAHALGTIGSNIANVNTGGFKKTDTRFETVLSNTLNTGAGADSQVSFASPESAFGGVKPKDYQIIDKQGIVTGTARALDVAIVGDGFFQVSPTLQVSGEILYTRDGGFDINVAGATTTSTDVFGNTFTIQEGYLADKSGNFLLGVAADPLTGLFSASAAAAPMRVDQFAFLTQFRETTLANLNFNLPSGAQFGDPSQNLSLKIVDSQGALRTLSLSLDKTTTQNQWQLGLSADNLTASTVTPGAAFSLATGVGTGRALVLDPATRTVKITSETLLTAPLPGVFQGLQAGDSITIAGAAAGPPTNNGTFTIEEVSTDFSTITVNAATPLLGGAETLTTAATVSSTKVVPSPLVFDSKGTLTSPTSITVNLTWANGATNAFTLDISQSTQFSGAFTLVNNDQNGLSSSAIRDLSFDSAGQVIGNFEDGTSRAIYKVPLATFTNPNGLEMRDGNTFAESSQSGPARVVFADTSGVAILTPNALELSNVDITNEFTQMIRVQQAYNSSATVFKTVDEMTIVARDLKT